MADGHHALAGKLAAERVEEGRQPEDDVAPTLAAGRTVIELPQRLAQRGLIGKQLLDAAPGEPVESAQLSLAQPLVDHQRNSGELRFGNEDFRGAPRAKVRRAEDRRGPHLGRLRADVPADRGGLLLPDRKSTRLNSSHLVISYAVFCL